MSRPSDPTLLPEPKVGRGRGIIRFEWVLVGAIFVLAAAMTRFGGF